MKPVTEVRRLVLVSAIVMGAIAAGTAVARAQSLGELNRRLDDLSELEEELAASDRDIAKEIEIFRAHKAAPVVIITEAERYLFNPGVDILAVPACHPELAFVLAAMVGHIFGY